MTTKRLCNKEKRLDTIIKLNGVVMNGSRKHEKSTNYEFVKFFILNPQLVLLIQRFN